MARETKAQEALRLDNEQKTADRAAKAAAKKAEKLAAVVPENKTVVVDFSDDVKALLKALIEVLSKTGVTNKVPVVKKEAEPVVKQSVQQELPLKEAEVKTVVSLTEIRELINVKASEQKTSGIIQMLKNHGAANASSLKQENYDAFYQDLTNL